MRFPALPLGTLLLAASLAASGRDTPRFEGPLERTAPEGHVLLAWTASGLPDGEYELVRAATPDFGNSRRLYRGPDLGSFQSGLEEGRYWYRVRPVTAEGEPAGPWSPPLQVEVAYVSRRRVAQLMLLGGVVFLATAGTIVASTLRVYRSDGSGGNS